MRTFEARWRTLLAPRGAWWRSWLSVAISIVVVLVLSHTVSQFELRQWTSWLALTVLTLSLVWVWGHAGVFSFGQVLFFGIGAYAYGAGSINLVDRTGETLSSLIIGMVAAVVVAAILGYFLFYGDVSGVYVAIATLAATLVAFTLMASTADPSYAIGDARLGGYNGMSGIAPITLPGGYELAIAQLFVFTAVTAILVAFGVLVLQRSPFGRAARALRENEARTTLVGFDTRLHKLMVFVIGGAIAGLAGGLYAAWGGFADPSLFGLEQATLVVAWSLVGGRTSVLGAFVGVFGLQQLTTSVTSTGTNVTPLVVGAVLILIVLVLPRGVVPTLTDLLTTWRRREDSSEPVHDAVAVDERGLPSAALAGRALSLRAENVEKAFGGVKAVAGVDWSIDGPGVEALLGPNGAGKSTLFNLFAGSYTPTAGKVYLDGRDISRWRPNRRTRAGMSIKRQVPSLFGGLSTRENLWLAAYGSGKSAAESTQVADEFVRWLGPAANVEEVQVLAHGQQQWLDIAMALTASPSVLLLDEPTAGMGREESSQIARVARQLGEQIPVIVVEHDMEFVEELGAPITVLDRGRTLARGTLEEIKSNDDVLEVYLGRTVSTER
ncbi:ABC transporter permease subunit [[Mycobacterium] wendilense]|uniref:ATP-binding cassette domain-containing protein n=1 Tax=[Mycobacterium] wendilense TaxID=3064284 RepID=A0ABM9MFN3_9MYCO|nr:ATP-binding cassette domain-containing protein [Mycolicibacterium sp. MU0050]CAJ1584016.1 ATP-binding cassette domain-containing protein [Mycolicibacterium sp. MU0050]